MQITERQAEGITILEIQGKILMGEGDVAIKRKIDELIAKDVKNIVLNLAHVPYMDSSGLGELIRCYTTVRKSGGVMKLAHVTEKIVDLLTITKLITVFEYFDTEAKALESFQK